MIWAILLGHTIVQVFVADDANYAQAAKARALCEQGAMIVQTQYDLPARCVFQQRI